MTPLAVLDANYAWLGLVPAGVLVVALIMNVASFGTRDLNRKAGVSANLFFIALLVENATYMIRNFGGGSEKGMNAMLVCAVLLHIVSAGIALRAIFEFRTIGKWPYGRRRATWGFWLNVIALLVIAAWFFLAANPRLYDRVFT